MPETEDLYEILQVHPSAHPDVIRAAYRRLALLYHPDTNPSPEANGMMVRLNLAFEVLNDPVARGAYDLTRRAKQGTHSTEHSPQPNEESVAPTGYFSLGSTKLEVLEIQWPPGDVSVNRMLDEETWCYDGYAEVTFDMATSRVHG